MSLETVQQTWPDERGYFGAMGGRYVPETLVQALCALEDAYRTITKSDAFVAQFDALLHHFVGRPTPLYHAKRLSSHFGGAAIYLKREDLAHTGAHKINNAIGQSLLARHMGKSRIVAETGAGQHGVATATACALLDLPCTVYMGAEDVERQRANVVRMNLLGAEVKSVDAGSRTLKDAINEAIRDWVTNVDTTCYIIGSVVGPHPYPAMVRDFQSVIGNESRAQMLERCGCLPDRVVCCVGGGSNAMGMFHAFVEDSMPLIAVEGGGLGLETDQHAASLCMGSVGVLHGAKSLLMQDGDGQIQPTHSVSAGLDYPGVGPEMANLKMTGRVNSVSVIDDLAVNAFGLLSRLEGIIPALESAHAIAHATELAESMSPDQTILVNLSGRGDKDLDIVERRLANNADSTQAGLER